MRDGLGAMRAAVREYRRLGEYRPVAAEATSACHTKRERAEVGTHAHAASKAEAIPGSALGSRLRRDLTATAAAVALVVVGLIAASLGTSKLNEGAAPSPSHIVIDPDELAPAASLGPSPAISATTGHVPLAPLPATSASQRPASGTVPASTDQTAQTGTPATTDSAATSVSPTLLAPCRAVVAVGQGWPSVLKGADRLRAIAAAGNKKNVIAYCAALLATTPRT